MGTLVGDILDFFSVDDYRSASENKFSVIVDPGAGELDRSTGDDQICIGVYGVCILALHDNGYLPTVDLYFRAISV